MSSVAERRARIKAALEDAAFVRGEKEQIVSRRGRVKTTGWLFDLRRILMRASIMEDLSALFWEQFAHDGVQIGCLESAGIPLMATLVATAKDHGVANASGFFVRKSRKKDGLLRMIEGEIRDNVPIVLVDDLINSGKSLMRQVEVVEGLGKKVTAVWTLVRFRDERYYEYFRERGIAMYSLFTLDDFKDTLGTENIPEKPERPLRAEYEIHWRFASNNPSYFHVVPKSDPALDERHVYAGSDAGAFRALNKEDGTIAWQYQVGFHPKGKGIFSSPALARGTVFFGAYDGNVYALDAATGKKHWMFMEADWVGSSPAVAEDLGLVFIGLEFGLWNKHGGIVALDMKTGEKRWEYSMREFTHSSPRYIKEKQQVVIGSNDGAAYLFDAKTGALIWKLDTAPEAARASGTHDIKESFAYDPAHDLLAFGNRNGDCFLVDRAAGEIRFTFKAEFGIYSTPLFAEGNVYFASLDKHLYCFDVETHEERWRWYGHARIFSSPVFIDGSIYIGANTGRMTELDPHTGEERSFLLLTERITNRPAYDASTKRFFVPTFANEIYCASKRV